MYVPDAKISKQRTVASEPLGNMTWFWVPAPHLKSHVMWGLLLLLSSN